MHREGENGKQKTDLAAQTSKVTDQNSPANTNKCTITMHISITDSIKTNKSGYRTLNRGLKEHRCKRTRRNRHDSGTTAQRFELRVARLARDACFEVRWEEAGVETQGEEEAAAEEAVDAERTGALYRKHDGAGSVARRTHHSWLQ